MKSNYLIVLIILITGLSFIKITNPHGLGVSPDSVKYIQAAENLIKGNGLTDNEGNFLNHWPPGYSLALASASSISGYNVKSIGQSLNLIILLSLIFLFFLVLKDLKINLLFRLLFPLMIFFSVPGTVFLNFWSEGLFSLLLIASVLFFIKHYREKKQYYLLISGVFSGLFLLTRYAGIGFIGAFILFIFINKTSLKIKIRHILIYILPILLCILLWFFFAASYGNHGVNRSFSLHLIPLSEIKSGFSVIVEWFTAKKSMKIGWIVLILILLILIILFRKTFIESIQADKNKFNKEILLFSLLTISYFLFLLLSISIFDAATPLYNRILYPIYPFLLVLTALFFDKLIKIKALKYVAFTFIIILTANITLKSYNIYRIHYKSGSGFTGIKWKNSDVLRYVTEKDLSKIYTNGYDFIAYYRGSYYKKIPKLYDPYSLRNNQNKNDDLKSMKKEVTDNQYNIVYFENFNRKYLVSKEELLKEFKDYNTIYLNDGIIINND